MTWQAIGGSVQGADHIRRNAPNQDALAWRSVDGALVAALADGHGSSACFRSDTGAAIAVQTACGIVDPDDLHDPASIPERIVGAWRDAVERHAHAMPFSEAETTAAWNRSLGQVTRDLTWLAYGTTLLIAVAGRDRVAMAQLGDGDIVVARPGGPVERPVPADDRLVANETTSLAAATAPDDFRTATLDIGDAAGTLVMVCSDGYTNSFATESGFLEAASDYRSMIADVGLEVVAGNLEKWLREHSDLGSGDDVTLGLLSHTGAS